MISNKGELQFSNLCDYLGYKAYHDGWPDFLVKKKGVDVYFYVEVKSGNNCKMSISQRRLFMFLKRALGVQIYIYSVKTNKLYRLPKKYHQEQFNKDWLTFEVNQILK